MPDKPKNPMTVTELARLGGLARKDALTPERRKRIALKAIRARWRKAKESKE